MYPAVPPRWSPWTCPAGPRPRAVLCPIGSRPSTSPRTRRRLPWRWPGTTSPRRGQRRKRGSGSSIRLAGGLSSGAWLTRWRNRPSAISGNRLGLGNVPRLVSNGCLGLRDDRRENPNRRAVRTGRSVTPSPSPTPTSRPLSRRWPSTRDARTLVPGLAISPGATSAGTSLGTCRATRPTLEGRSSTSAARSSSRSAGNVRRRRKGTRARDHGSHTPRMPI